MQVPPIPTWDAMHPLIIHFPIVLLLLVPVFILIAGIMRPPKNAPYMTVSLLLLLLGTASLFFAASSGEESAELADRSGSVDSVIAMHEHLASRTEVLFCVLAALFVVLYAWPRVRKLPQSRLVSTVLPISFLLLYGVGIAYLVNTAHAGGRLVHEFGVHALVAPSGPVNASSAKSPNHDREEGE